MQAWITDHYDAGHICNNCAKGSEPALQGWHDTCKAKDSPTIKEKAPVIGALV